MVSTVMTTVVSAKMSASETKSDAWSTAIVVRLGGIVSLRSIVAIAPTVRANGATRLDNKKADGAPRERAKQIVAKRTYDVSGELMVAE